MAAIFSPGMHLYDRRHAAGEWQHEIMLANKGA
jgi:hypothetical protein